MKPLLQRDRAASAVPARSSFATAARLGAWAKESLVARGLAVLAGLVALAVIGGPALAGGGGARSASVSEPSPSSSPAGTPLESVLDAGIALGSQPAREPPVIELDDTNGSSGVEDTLQGEPPARDARGKTGGAKKAARATPDDPVDLNTARVDDLRRLPGVGAKRAEAILALRARLPGGRFRQLEDLLKVKGVGRAMIKRIHPLVRLSGGEPARN